MDSLVKYDMKQDGNLVILVQLFCERPRTLQYLNYVYLFE